MHLLPYDFPISRCPDELISAIGALCAPTPLGLDYDSKGVIAFNPSDFAFNRLRTHVKLALNRVKSAHFRRSPLRRRSLGLAVWLIANG
jgi:hypothetical protein